MMEKLLTIREVAEILRVSRRTIERWVKQGKIKAVRIGPHTLRFTPSDVEDLITGKGHVEKTTAEILRRIFC